MSSFSSKDCPHDDSRLFFCLTIFGTCLGPAPDPSPPPVSILLYLTQPLLFSACVSPDAGLMLGQVQDPSLALSPWTSVEALPWGPTSSAEAAQAGLPHAHSLLTFQDVSLRCNPHFSRQVLLVCP